MQGGDAGARALEADVRGTVLFVDDDYDLRVLVRAVLEAHGYEVFTAANGRDAIELLRQIDPPQLVLADLRMPIMDGWEFVRRLKKESVFESLPVIVQSSEDRTPPLGIAGVVKKPVDVGALIAIVARHCGPPR